ncbi:MAG: ABC transporter ATP-binding protein [Candidatus Heimdallarchaeota archaeon]|nr:ABC transporter ATP-binding protein [Candidatus Heimdallarchaeota archaeon]MCK5048315.1 ABC transporter ATP-binding protein [Candidatus Heimdallarchaeota archaeon]
MSDSEKTSENDIIELHDVKKYFTSGQTVVEAIRGISISITEGSFVSVLGASGSGKSTLLSLISGLERLTDGEIYISGEKITYYSEDELAMMRRKKIGIVFQFFNLQETLNSQENIEFPMLIAGAPVKERRERSTQLLSFIGLDKRADHLPHELSGGEKQRIGIARSLANSPAILLADEPTGDLDSVTGEEIIELLVDLNKEDKVTIIMVTHDEEALRPGMRVLLLSDGQIIDDFIYEGKHQNINERLGYLPAKST